MEEAHSQQETVQMKCNFEAEGLCRDKKEKLLSYRYH